MPVPPELARLYATAPARTKSEEANPKKSMGYNNGVEERVKVGVS
jgi:hypothetical protein